MNYSTLSPETRAAWIETCEKILTSEPFICKMEYCPYCPASIRNNGRKITCDNVKGGSIYNDYNHPAIRAYFERILKELRSMDTERKMTKEEAKENIKKIEGHIVAYKKEISAYERNIAEYQAIIDAPEPDPRVGKLFVWELDGIPSYFMVKRINEDNDYITPSGVNYDSKHSRPVTRDEALAMVYELKEKKTCNNCKNNHCKSVSHISLCSEWQPIWS